MKFIVAIFSILIGSMSAAQAQEISWPQELDGDKGAVVVIYQPQVETFTGNVYQRGDNGNWISRDNGQWSQAANLDRSGGASTSRQPSTADMSRSSSGYQGNQRTTQPSQQATRPQLERDYGARQQGAQRSHNYNRQGGARRRR